MDTNTYTEHQISYSKFLKKIGRCEKESSKLKKNLKTDRF
jgi:hypothetical protein